MATVKKRSPAKVTDRRAKKRTPSTDRRAVKRPVKKKNKAKKGPSLAVFILLALALVAFLGYFIFIEEKPDTPPKQEHSIVKKKEEVLPEKPVGKWDYVDDLKTKEVEVDLPEKKASTKRYQMQCGSFRKKTQAESLKAKIAFQGLNSEVRKTGNWYRVILGPYKRKRLAERDKHKMQRAKIYGCAVWLWR